METEIIPPFHYLDLNSRGFTYNYIVQCNTITGDFKVFDSNTKEEVSKKEYYKTLSHSKHVNVNKEFRRGSFIITHYDITTPSVVF